MASSGKKRAAQDPGNAKWQRDLSVSHDWIGNVLRARGDLSAALGTNPSRTSLSFLSLQGGTAGDMY